MLGEHPDAAGQVWHLPNDPDTRTTRQLGEFAFQLAGTAHLPVSESGPLSGHLTYRSRPGLRPLR